MHIIWRSLDAIWYIGLSVGVIFTLVRFKAEIITAGVGKRRFAGIDIFNAYLAAECAAIANGFPFTFGHFVEGLGKEIGLFHVSSLVNRAKG